MRLNLRLIECFRAVMTAGTVTAAAEMLHTSQPAVSRAIQQLEAAVGLQLFDRVKGRLVPTAPALALFEEVGKTFLGLDHLSRVAAGLKSFPQGSVSIVCAPAFSQGFIADAAQRFLAQHGAVSLSIETQPSPTIAEWLAGQRFDLGLAAYPLTPPGTTARLFAEPDEVCVLPAGHALASRDVVTPADLGGSDFVFLGGNDPYRYRLDQVFEAAGVTRRLVVETRNSATACALVERGAGIAIVNPFTAVDCAGRGLAVRRFAASLPFTAMLVRARLRPSSPLVDRFVAALEATRDDYLARAAHLTGAHIGNA